MTSENGWYFARGNDSVGPLRLAGRIVAAAGKPGGKEEGSILGGLGTLLGGDNS